MIHTFESLTAKPWKQDGTTQMPEDIQTTDEATEQQESVTTETETPEEVADTTSTDEAEEPSTEESTEQASTGVQPEQADPYKEKFVHSQRESILNHERVKVANARIEQLTKLDTPTDEAMRELYSDWDSLKACQQAQEAPEVRPIKRFPSPKPERAARPITSGTWNW
jgi:hypothetical protein